MRLMRPSLYHLATDLALPGLGLMWAPAAS
jgi:hypothetical protein